MNETFTSILLSLQAGVPWRTVKGFQMTDFPNLKTKYPDLIPIRMDFECGSGWEQVLDKYFGEVAGALPSGARLRLERVYEKYGSLRVDAMPEGPVARSVQIALDKAEVLADLRSYRYCETCGKPGSLRDKPWLSVDCEAHANGAPPLPPDDGRITLDGVAYEFDEGLDDLVPIKRRAKRPTGTKR
ncbi:MAG: hypothetical protein EOR67_30915 [Mesorhizobium sp.]|uniref:hypothetical protein n=1 Tax=Mesorhizobium sp. TaxID=1871066 RepID=UPI000FE86C73|nr:hypothetical protein [Mesorhizobium sp.]RWL80658.1 MAG: hypothetical protein EOR67_30915 [Mesorhizobium sp.]